MGAGCASARRLDPPQARLLQSSSDRPSFGRRFAPHHRFRGGRCHYCWRGPLCIASLPPPCARERRRSQSRVSPGILLETHHRRRCYRRIGGVGPITQRCVQHVCRSGRGGALLCCYAPVDVRLASSGIGGMIAAVLARTHTQLPWASAARRVEAMKSLGGSPGDRAECASSDDEAGPGPHCCLSRHVKLVRCAQHDLLLHLVTQEHKKLPGGAGCSLCVSHASSPC